MKFVMQGLLVAVGVTAVMFTIVLPAFAAAQLTPIIGGFAAFGVMSGLYGLEIGASVGLISWMISPTPENANG